MAVEAAAAGLAAQKDLTDRDVAVYIGIPFCPTRCAYCSFVSSSVEKSLAMVEPYVDALEAEMRAGGKLLADLGLRVRAFYMGGGTPTTLSAPQMDRLLTTFRKSFDLSACTEYTVEAGRPDTITPEKLEVLQKQGVTRLSINPQTMEDNVLRAIGRRHTADDIRRAMAQVRQAGFTHVNMDLIAGLPEDTAEGFRRSLDECLTFGCDNLTVHTLSLKKGSTILLQGLSIPTADAVAEMLDYADPALRQAGYAPYYLYRQKYMSGSFENVGWCRPGGGKPLQHLYHGGALLHSVSGRRRLHQNGGHGQRAHRPGLQPEIPQGVHGAPGEMAVQSGGILRVLSGIGEKPPLTPCFISCSLRLC
jgi:oxygen-independent coproporphyrinogen-3 oxidase